jgi:hypothetical protein
MRTDDIKLITTLQDKVYNNQINFIPSTIEGQYKYVNDDIMIVISLRKTPDGQEEYTLDLYNSEAKKYSIYQKTPDDPKEFSNYALIQNLYLNISNKSDDMHNKFIDSIIASINKDDASSQAKKQADAPEIIGDNAALESI